MSEREEVSRLAENELEHLFDLDGFAFSEPMSPETREWLGAHSNFERIFVSRDGGLLVGSAAADETRMTVPGLEQLPAALVVAVAVSPTHRREGRMARLMRAQLDDIRERGEVIATLYASEGGIYGRFGFGMATFGSRYEIEKAAAELRPEVQALVKGRCRFVSREEGMSLFPTVFARYAPTRAGEVERKTLGFWSTFGTPGSDSAKRFLVVYEEKGSPEAYASYDVSSVPLPFSPRQLNLRELCAVSPAGYAGMWSFLLGVDLIAEIRTGGRPVDEQLRFLLTNQRVLRSTVSYDRSWVRLVDVSAALAGRRYPVPGSLSLAVRDSFCPWNAATYRLTVSEEWGTAEVERGAGTADIEIDAAALGSLYLGGVPASAFAMTSSLREATPGAIGRADRMFANDRPPYCLTQY